MLTIDEINRMSAEQFTAALGWIFEDSPWVAELAAAQRPFRSRKALHRAMVQQVEAAGIPSQRALLCAHPDLGAPAKVSPASAQEQAAADRLARLRRQTVLDLQEMETRGQQLQRVRERLRGLG